MKCKIRTDIIIVALLSILSVTEFDEIESSEDFNLKGRPIDNRNEINQKKDFKEHFTESEDIASTEGEVNREVDSDLFEHYP